MKTTTRPTTRECVSRRAVWLTGATGDLIYLAAGHSALHAESGRRESSVLSIAMWPCVGGVLSGRIMHDSRKFKTKRYRVTDPVQWPRA